jgi:thioredoxin reductase
LLPFQQQRLLFAARRRTLDTMNVKQIDNAYDVVVLGGGAAGLNGALMLARSRRSVLVIDAGDPRNGPADAVHGLLGHDGVPPAELYARGRAEVEGYGGHTTTGKVLHAEPDGTGFRLSLASGQQVRARRLLVATGLVDELPDVPGLRERWGRDVVHCPYCHGWEMRDRAIGVLATGPRAAHQALLFSQLSDDVTLFVHTAAPPSEEELRQLAARGVRIVDGEVARVSVADDAIDAVVLADGTTVPVQALAVSPRLSARTEALTGLGLKAVPHPSGAGDLLPADPMGRTEVPGVWAAGNVTDPMAQVGASAAAGAMAGAQINYDLILEDAG